MPNIILKATEACNANCVYCDVVHRKKPRTISLDLLKKVFERFDEYLKEFPKETIHVIWHGGEPCVAGLKLYKKVLEYLDTICSTTRDRLVFAVQSNLTMIDEDFIEVFNKMGIHSIGTSYETIPGVRGIGPKRDSRLYNQKFFEGINLLEKHGMSWGFIYVVTKKVLDKPLDVLYHLTNLKPRGGFDLHPVLVYEEAAEESKETAITQEEYADFLGTIFQEYWEHRDRYKDINPFESYIRQYTKPLDCFGCCDAPTCGLHLYLGPDGETAQCGRAADWDILQYGNIKDKSLKTIFEDDQRKLVDNRFVTLPDTDCKGCEYWQICHGGCPLDAYNSYKDYSRKTDQCLSKKLFLKKYFEPITGFKLPKIEK